MAVQQNAREIGRDSDKLNLAKMDKQTEALSGNIVIFDEEGNSSDSGYNVSNVPGFTVDLNKVIPFETLGEAINSTDVSKILKAQR